MSDFFSTAVAMQQEIVRAQKAQLEAAQAMADASVAAGEKAMELQKSAQTVADANAKAWLAWANMWGWM